VLQLKEFRTRAKGFADLLNYAALIEDGIVLNKDGSLLAAWSYCGEDLDSATSHKLSALSARVNTALMGRGSGWMAHVDAIRRPSLGYLTTSKFPDRTTRLIDEERRARYEAAGRHFESEYCFTLTYLPPADVEGKLAAYFAEPQDNAQDVAIQQLEFFRSSLSEIEGLLSTSLKLTRLGRQSGVNCEQRWCEDRLLRHLNRCITGLDHPINLPPVPMYLDCVLGSQDFYGDSRPKIGRMHIRPISIVGYPQYSHPAMLEFLHRLPLAYRWSTRFIFLDSTIAEKQISNYEKKWFQRRKSLRGLIAEQAGGRTARPNAHADAMADDAQSALAEASSGSVTFGYCTSVVVIMNEDSAIADTSARNVLKLANAAGFNARLEDVNAVEAYLGSLPGHGYANVRRPLMHTLNLADLLPLTTIWPGPEENPCPYYPSNSSPLAYTSTNGATPFRLDLHVSDVGHTLVLGPTGSGKSTLLAFLMAQHFRYSNAQVFAFDKGYSAFILCKAAGGEHYDIAGQRGGLSFYPLARVDQISEQAWAAEWLETLASLQGLSVRPHHRKALTTALRLLGESKGRSLTDLLSTLQDHELRDTLVHYTLSGAMGTLLDADQDGLADNAFQVFEMENLMELGRNNVIPVLLYLFHRIEERLTGQPTLVVLDEAWLLLLNPLFEERIRAWLKTLRKANAAVVFSTHSPTDILESHIANVVMESCPTKILLPNPEATNPSVAAGYSALGVTAEQIEIIASALPKRQYYYLSPLGKRVFDLDLGDVAFSFLGAGGKDEIASVQSLIEACGDVWPAIWLHSRGLSDAGETWLRLRN